MKTMRKLIETPAFPALVLLVALTADERPDRQGRRQVEEQQHQGRHDAKCREQAELLNRHQVAGEQRDQTQGGRKRCQRARSPAVRQRAFAGSFNTAFGNRLAIIVDDVDGARQA